MAREPLLHFLLIGAGIYGLYGMFGTGEAANDERVVTITAGEIQSLTDQWSKTWSRSPTSEELTGAIRHYARTQILFREAMAMGLDNGDRVIERRLAQRLELLAESLITPEEPSEEVLIDWYAANADRFKQPDLYTVTQIFFDPDKREEKTLDDAQAARDKLNLLEQIPPDIGEYGDRLMLRNYYPNRSEAELGKLFGTEFADQVVELQPGTWQGPILSGYGTHVVFLSDVLLVPLPAFGDVKESVRDEWMAEQITELSERFIEKLMSRYEIIIEETEAPISAPGGRASQ